MSNDIALKNHESPNSPFDSIRQIDENGKEYWYARDLMLLLGYKKWERFADVVEKAELSFYTNPLGNILDHLSSVEKVVNRPQGGGSALSDFKLSRYLCYLIAMNGDVRKPAIASAQSYFAVKTRQAEIAPSIAPPVLPELSRLDILKMALDSEEKRIEAENKLAIASQQIEVLAPMAKLGECMTTHEKDVKTVGEIAQAHNMGRNTLFSFLREIKFIQQKSTRPYQSHINDGHCEVKLVSRSNKSNKLDPVCLVTMKGQEYIAKKLVERDKLDKAEVLLEKTVTLA